MTDITKVPDTTSDEQQTLSQEQKIQMHLLRMFLINNKDKVEQWAKAHSKNPHIANNPPVYWDENKQQYWWANRATRRKK